MPDVFLLFPEHKKRLWQICFTVVLCLSSASLFPQKKQKTSTGYSKNYRRHVVNPGQTFRSIGKLYGISGVKLADYNNLEYYEEEVLAKYLSIPLRKKNSAVKRNEKISGTVGVGSSSAIRDSSNVKKIAGIIKQEVQDTIKDEQKRVSDTISIVKIATTPGPQIYSSLPAAEKRNRQLARSEDNISRPLSRLEKLLLLVKVQIAVTAFLVALIFFFMTLKNRKEALKAKLNDSIRKVLVSETLAEKSFSANIRDGLSNIEYLKKQLNKKANRQFVIDEIINGRKNLKGKVGENFLKLYLTLHLEVDSSKKLRSKKWDDVAKGIQELATMEQHHKMSEIFSEINSKNEWVRMEAQSGLVHLSGFGGLWFLNILNYPISGWQQMKLIKLLAASPKSEIPDLHVLLTSPNETLVVFTLKLIGEFQQRSMHNAVVKCLGHKSEAVRLTAIKCLNEISNSYTASVLMRRFATELTKNKTAIIDVLGDIGDKDQIDFLLEVLSLCDNLLKISAARALTKLGREERNLLEEFCNTKGYPYTEILLHIKSEKNYDMV